MQVTLGTSLKVMILDTTHIVHLTQRQVSDMQQHMMAVVVVFHPMTVITTVIHMVQTHQLPKMDTCIICGTTGLVAR